MDHFQQAKNLFQVQTELIEAKVNMATSNAMDKVLAKIDDLRNEMHKLREEMNKRFLSMENRFSLIENRLIAVETKLGMVHESQRIVKNKFIDYAFQSGWLLLNGFVTYAVIQFHMIVK